MSESVLSGYKATRVRLVALDPIKFDPRVYWTASKTFYKKHVSWESEQRFKLWGENISIQEKQAMPYQYSLYKEY